MTASITVSSIFLLTSIVAFGQHAAPAFSPVPLWPLDGNIPASFSAHSVFFNPETNEIVVALPSPGGGRAIRRFELHNQADVKSQVTVTPLTNGLFAYDYVLSASPTSKRPLKTWSLLIPDAKPQLTPGDPAFWHAGINPSGLVDRLMSEQLALVFADFSIAPGATLPTVSNAGGTFRVVSTYLPGYVSGFALSNSQREISAAALADLPQDVANEVRRATAPEWDTQMALVIGSRFAPPTPKPLIAQSLHEAVSRLIKQGSLSADSQFVQTALLQLASQIRTPAVSGAVLDLSFLSLATTGPEKEMATAMKLSLR